MNKSFILNKIQKIDKHSIIIASSIIFVMLVLISLFYLYIVIHQDANNFDEETIISIEIQKGDSFRKIVNILDDNKIINNRFKFVLTARLLGKTRHIQSGKFNINGGINYVSLVYLLEHATFLQKKITIPEGMELIEIANIFKNELNIPIDSFLVLKENVSQFSIQYKSVKSIEGFLFPDTYYFFEDAKAEDVIQKMVNNFKKNINLNLIWGAKEKGMTVNELITLASIIQGEVIYDSEMPTVSSVYHNRLKKNMRLQADPTIQYIIPGPDRLLKLSELRIDSEYNTYMNRGLPPGPINNPGLKAILSAISPDTTDFIYFVARGDGYHTFSKTLRQHNNAKNKLKKIRQKQRLINKQKKTDTIINR